MGPMLSVKLSSKHQISIPSTARQRLGIGPGDRLTVEIREDSMVLRLRPSRPSERLRGLIPSDRSDPVTRVRRMREESER